MTITPPFTGSSNLLAHFRTYVHLITARLGCGVNKASAAGMTLNRTLASWRKSDGFSATNANWCKVMPPDAAPVPYLSPLYLLLHEARHAEPDDPGHTCDNEEDDPSFSPGSGHARAATYLMWVDEHSTSDTSAVRDEARKVAKDLLTNRFCTPVASDNTIPDDLADLIDGVL